MTPLVVTRASHQAQPWCDALTRADLPGALPVHLPLIDIVPRRPVQWLNAQGAESATEAALWRDASAWSEAVPRVLVFVSANAVACFFTPEPILSACAQGWPAGAIACATGPATAQALLEQGVPPEALWCPSAERAGDSEDLWALMRQQRPPEWWQGRPVLIVRGTGGRPWLGQQLAEAGGRLCYAQAYSLGEPLWGASHSQNLQRVVQTPGSVWWLASAAALDALAQRLNQAGWLAEQVLSQAQAWVLHTRQQTAARCLGFGHVQVVPDTAPGTLQQAWSHRRIPEPITMISPAKDRP